MTHSTKTKFNYEGKIWGSSTISNKYTNFQGLDLKFFSESLDKFIKSKWRVVDLGSGAGNIAGFLKLKHKNWDIEGVDISKNAVRQAKKLFPKVKFKVSDVRNINYKNRDLIYAFDTLEHFLDLEKIIKKVNQALRENGFFYVAIPLERQFPTPYYFLNKLGWEGKKNRSGHINVFNDHDFINLVESTGFRLISKRYSYHFLMSIFDVIFYFFQEISNKTIAFESTVDKSNNIILKIIKNTISIIGFIESSVFKNLKGGKGHFLFIKDSATDFFSINNPITVAEDYQKKWGLRKVVQPRDLEIIKILKSLDLKKNIKILDFGCANGIWLERILSGTDNKGIGVDISSKLIEIAKARKNAKGEYYLTDKAWPIKKNSIDFCYSFDTFEHIRDYEKEVKRIAESLKKDGKLLIYTLNPNNKYTIDWLFESLGSDFMYKRADHNKKMFIDPKKLKKVLERNGFNDVEYTLYDGPANLIGRVLGFLFARFGFLESNNLLIRFFYPLNCFIDSFFLKKGYSNGYFLWAKKLK